MNNYTILETNKIACINGDWFIGTHVGLVNTDSRHYSSHTWNFVVLSDPYKGLISIYDTHLMDVYSFYEYFDFND